MSWTAPSEDGGAVITDYKVEYDQGAGAWIIAEASVLGTSHTETSLTANVEYFFRVYAQNAVGYSSASDPFGITTATRPSQLQHQPRHSMALKLSSIGLVYFLIDYSRLN